MGARSTKFDFANAAVPSLANIHDRVARDTEFPDHRRAAVRSSLARLAIWSGRAPAAIAFVESVIEALFRGLKPAVLNISPKRLANAHADVRFVMEFYGARRRYEAPMTPAVLKLWGLLTDKYDRCSLARLLRFLSVHQITPAEMSDTISAQFLAALKAEARLRIKPEIFHQSAIRAWNKAVARHAGWPQVILVVPSYAAVWTTSWAGLPASLELAVDRFLSAGNGVGGSVFDVDATRPLKKTTIDTQKDHVRCAASALIRAGVPAVELTNLKSICAPPRFRLAIETTVAMRGGRLGGYLMVLAWTLVKLARYGGVLSTAEIIEVNQLYKRLATKRKSEQPHDVNRDEALLGQLDDPRVLDALLSLPSKTVEGVLKSKERTRVAALLIQKACALELWLCAPLRLGNFAGLRLDQHFHRLRIEGEERILVRLAGHEVKNGEPLEHYLSADAAALLDLYVQEFRRFLTPAGSPWLWPGYGDAHKVDAVLSGQMKRFVNDAIGLDFHPHLIRKISTKILLDADPAGIVSNDIRNCPPCVMKNCPLFGS